MSLPRVTEPLGRPVPYIVAAYQGESLNLPGTKSTFRVLASAKESDGQLSVFRMDGVSGDPVVFHHHNEAHDIFMCTRGHMKVWAGNEARLLGPGDFCSVPPIDYFRFISERYDGILAEEFDDRDTAQILFPKKKIIEEEYDVIFDPHHPACKVGEWTEDDTKIPEGTEAYYLRANTGPRHILGGLLSRPFITKDQSDGKFAITSIESSNTHPPSILDKPFTFSRVHQVYYILDGAIEVTIAGTPNRIHPGETVFIPADTEISITFTERYTRFWSFSSGDGLETFIRLAGREFEGAIFPSKPDPVQTAKVVKAAESIGLAITC